MKVITVLLLVLLTATFTLAQKTVLLVVGAGQESTGPEPSDDAVLDVLESFGWDVETYYLDDPSKMTDDLGLDKDLVVISSTINSGHIGNFYYDKNIPVITWEQGMYGKLGIATGGNILTVSETLMSITEPGHPSVDSFTGDVEVLATSPNELTLTSENQFGPELQVITEMVADDGTPMAAIFAYETGATLLDGSPSPARRMGFFFRDKTAINATEDAMTILGLCCKWTMGADETSVEQLKAQISSCRLFNNYPNPFNPSTTLSFSLPSADQVTLTIYNSLGAPVRTLLSGSMAEGHHSVQWNGQDDAGNAAPSGVYYYELISSHGMAKGKMLLVK